MARCRDAAPDPVGFERRAIARRCVLELQTWAFELGRRGAAGEAEHLARLVADGAVRVHQLASVGLGANEVRRIVAEHCRRGAYCTALETLLEAAHAA